MNLTFSDEFIIIFSVLKEGEQMSWKDRFRERAKLRENIGKKAREAEQQRIAEFREIDKIYGRRIARVCFEFSKTFGWHYLSSDSSVNPEGPRYFHITGSSYGRDNEYGDSIEVMLDKSGVFIKEVHCGFDGRWEKKQEISFNEFTEDKLAQILLEI